ncbi:transaldolase/EF-hand domain-containing protein [Planctomycetes bacterium Pan216]|uniref:Transaldolase/EF-hand domain-containing protein n=1 Tax=Kolteria novifilia TaxID=2527975 RepID=A0A518B8C1_9BACT|nr:transaldolase/EF-hand domain-containing protein [Planctomycetes bacterium Pan216]
MSPILVPLFLLAIPGASSEPEPGTNVFYIASDRLLTIRFVITDNGQPYQKRWETYLDELFEEHDANKDGTLTGKESDFLPSRRLLQAVGVIPGGSQRSASLLMQRPSMPKTLTRAQLGRYFERLEFRPFRVAIESVEPTQPAQPTVINGQFNLPGVGEAFFRLVDVDGNRKLSEEELQGIAHSLRKFDLDRDETIAISEMAPQSQVQQPARIRRRNRSASLPPFASLATGISSRSLVTQMMDRFDGSQNGTIDYVLDQKELGLSDERFQALDKDRDGHLNRREVTAFLENAPPDLEVSIRLGKRPDEVPLMGFHSEDELARSVDVSETETRGTFNIGSVEIVVELQSLGMLESSPESKATRIKLELESTFKQADNDSNGYIDVREARGLGKFGPLFRELDTDRDRKLFAEEFLAGATPAMSIAAHNLVLTISGGGLDFFRLLDTTADSRITRRELGAVASRASRWDRNNDGQVSADEIPKQFQATIGLVHTGPSVPANAVRGVTVGGMSRPQSAASGPTWFRKMDRNGDGDVSRREFLGGEEDFRRLDRDGDNLLNGEEATAEPDAAPDPLTTLNDLFNSLFVN